MCALIDTGSQVCIITDKMFTLIKENNPNISLRNAYNHRVAGINSNETRIIGVVDLEPCLSDQRVLHSIPFAVVKEIDLPCCCILGVNFLSRAKITVDFDHSVLRYIDVDARRMTIPISHEFVKSGKETYHSIMFLVLLEKYQS